MQFNNKGSLIIKDSNARSSELIELIDCLVKRNQELKLKLDNEEKEKIALESYFENPSLIIENSSEADSKIKQLAKEFEDITEAYSKTAEKCRNLVEENKELEDQYFNASQELEKLRVKREQDNSHNKMKLNLV